MTGLVLVIMCIGAVACGSIASSKQRSALGWGVVGALAPLIGLIVILALSPARSFDLDAIR
jgi:hypothetical protein